MTENEAIEIHIAENIHRIEVIENFMYSNSDADKDNCKKNISVLTKINGLLQEIQQYRAIGLTPHMVKDLIASEKKAHKVALENADMLDEYRAIGTVEELKSMKENGAFTGIELAQLAAMQMRLKKYQAIGTVEGYKRAIKVSKENYRLYMEYKAKVQKYEAIGTIEEFKALKEKAESKICNMSGDGYADGHLVYDTYQCPNCGKEYEMEYEEHEYCPECGQHMCIKYEKEEHYEESI